MSSLSDLYRDAGDAVTPAGDVEDALRRGRRRRTLRQVGVPVLATAAVLGVVGAVPLLTAGGDDGQVDVAAPDDTTARATTDDLAGGLFAARGASDVLGTGGQVVLDFGDDGSFIVTAPCGVQGGRWTVADGVLSTSGVTQSAAGCADPEAKQSFSTLGAVIGAGPVLTLDSGALVLDAGSGTVAFEPITEDEVQPTVNRGDGGGPNGTGGSGELPRM